MKFNIYNGALLSRKNERWAFGKQLAAHATDLKGLGAGVRSASYLMWINDVDQMLCALCRFDGTGTM